MDYTVRIDEKNKVVLCICRGVLDLTSAKSMTRDIRKRAFDLDFVILYDVTEVTLGVSITDAYSFPRDMEKIYLHRQEDPFLSDSERRG